MEFGSIQTLGVFRHCHDDGFGLSGIGQMQANQLAAHLAAVEFERDKALVLTSPAERAVLTGKAIADGAGIQRTESSELLGNEMGHSHKPQVIQAIFEVGQRGDVSTLIIITHWDAAEDMAGYLESQVDNVSVTLEQRKLFGVYGHGVLVDFNNQSYTII